MEIPDVSPISELLLQLQLLVCGIQKEGPFHPQKDRFLHTYHKLIWMWNLAVCLTGVNYEVCLNGTHSFVSLERMGNSTQISQRDERAAHLAGPHCNIFDPLRQTSKSLVGGFAWTPAWEALNTTISTNLQHRVRLNRGGGGGLIFFSMADITTIVQSL